jgi:crossover junction endodeoxyribonuclease RuvC
MRVLGIDPGLNTTGYAVLESLGTTPTILEAGILKTARGRQTPDMATRLKTLYDGLMEVIAQYQPTGMAVEQLYAHYDHPRTAILMAHARGVIFLAGGQAGIAVASYNATQVKKVITGNGRASKEQMQFTMLRELKLKALPEPHDVADALAIALCHGYFATRGIDLESA